MLRRLVTAGLGFAALAVAGLGLVGLATEEQTGIPRGVPGQHVPVEGTEIRYVQAGAGIVADSNPTAEYEETRDNARAVILALELAQAGL